MQTCVITELHRCSSVEAHKFLCGLDFFQVFQPMRLINFVSMLCNSNTTRFECWLEWLAAAMKTKVS